MDNFTANFYDEPEPTPGYENHRVKEKQNLNALPYFLLGITGVGLMAVAAIVYHLKGRKGKRV